MFGVYYDVVFPAARFVTLMGADEDDWVVVARWLTVNQTLGPPCFLATDYADGVQLGNFLCNAQQVGHRAERLAAEIGVEACYNDTNVAVGKLLDEVNNAGIEKLNLVNSDHSGIGQEKRDNFGSAADVLSGNVLPVVTGDVLCAVVASVQAVFKNLNFLTGNDCPPDTADQLLCFAAEHTSANHLDTTSVVQHASPSCQRRATRCGYERGRHARHACPSMTTRK